MAKEQTKYVDGFVLVIPKENVAKYRKMARDAAKVWIQHGALAFRECMGDDLNPDMDGHPFLPFPKMTKTKSNETIWFSYIEYKSKAHRNQVNKKVMKTFEEEYKHTHDPMKDMPFDTKRMAYGGFSVKVNG